MNGYSKIKFLNTTKSRSIDFSDLFSPPQTPRKPIQNHSPNPTFRTQETKEININTKNTNPHDTFLEEEHEDGVGERFGVVLRRNCSVSSSSSQRFRAEKQSQGVQSAVRRAFSMRKSSSTSEGYCRIHDESDPISSPTDHEGLNTMQTRSKKKRGKILKACKRIFGF
ncbi:hypothetical protein HHK36_007901 [Tetracentron sinense]|uniref:Uncharacterized protein n=1 Tax=Tetracentron sinense TaxID=13715 RepID=A0A834ZEM7_TETSI|nr:hypothetical protein HHK36_007901 [Tetracentron sinense]